MHSVPRERKFCIKFCQTKATEENPSNERIDYKEAILTSLEEATGQWASREVPTATTFFRRLEARGGV
jgi:hypothetical protein